ncbi:MAG: hypothetical protein LBE17_09610, partial [Treponema sp.]|nr:hypothetical protein [Treponema sp.]
MKTTMVKKSGGLGRLSARGVSAEETLWFCQTATSKSLWMACWTNDKSVRLVTVSGKWDEI